MHSFQGVVQNDCLEELCFVKIGVSRKWVVTICLGGVGGGGDCYCMMLLDALEGCSKILKNSVFEHLVARCKYRKTSKNGPKRHFYPFFGGALKAYRNLFHFPPQKVNFQNPQKSLFYSVSRKSWWWSLFQKRPMLKEGEFCPKMITVFGYFRDKFLRSPKRGLGGGL